MEKSWDRVAINGNPKRGVSLDTVSPRVKAGHVTSFNNYRPTSGNGWRQWDQRPLMSKHRWSKEDVSHASPLLLQERFLHLQNMVEKLSQRLNLISKGKSVDATKHTEKGKLGGLNGKQGQLQHDRSLQHSIRKTVSLPCGMSGGHVLSVTHMPSAGVKKNKQQKVDGDGQRRPSIATVVTTSPHPEPVIIPQVELPVDPVKAEGRRKTPPVKGASYDATLRLGPICENSDPVFQPDVQTMNIGRPQQSVVRTVRKQPNVIGDAELADYLHYKFLHAERTNKTPLKMKNEADAYLRKFDLSRMTWREITVLVSKAIQAAMVPLDESVLLRNFFKDGKKLHEMQKHTDFVNKGELGKTGFFGKKKVLPKST